MNSATHSARSAVRQRRQQLRPLGERRRARAAGRRCGRRRAEQGARPLGVALAHRRPAPRRVQLVAASRPRPAAPRSPPAVRPPSRSASVDSGAASTNWPSHQDRSPRPAGGLGHHPVALHARVALVRRLDRQRRPRAVRRCGPRPTHDAARAAIRPASAESRQRRQQLGRRRPDIAAAVGQRLLQERLVRRPPAPCAASRGTSAGPRPAPSPRSSPAARGAAAASRRPYRRQQGDPLGEQALLPQPLDRRRVRRRPAAAGAARPRRAARTASPGSAGPATARAARRRPAPAGAGPYVPGPRPAARAAAAAGAAVTVFVRPRPATGAAAPSDPGAVPRGRPPPDGAGPVGQQLCEPSPGRRGQAPGAGPRAAGSGRAARRAPAADRPGAVRCARPPRPAARPARPPGGTGPAGGVRRSVPSSAAVTSSSHGGSAGGAGHGGLPLRACRRACRYGCGRACGYALRSGTSFRSAGPSRPAPPARPSAG